MIVDQEIVSEPVSDELAMEIARKGAARYRRWFSHLAQDLGQEAARAAIVARDRGLTEGGIMLSVKGSCLDYLKKNVIQGLVSDAVLERYRSHIKCDEEYDREIDELVSDYGYHTADQRLLTSMRLVCQGYTVREIGDKLGEHYQEVARRIREYGMTLSKHRRYRRALRRVGRI